MNMKKIKKFFTLARRHDGFTLVELIVVIAIIAILGGVAVPAYNGYITKAKKGADDVLLGALNTAYASACMENGEYNMTALSFSPKATLTETGVDMNKYDESFQCYYSGSGAFKYYQQLSFDKSTGLFTGISLDELAQALAEAWGLSSYTDAKKLLAIFDVIGGYFNLPEEMMPLDLATFLPNVSPELAETLGLTEMFAGLNEAMNLSDEEMDAYLREKYGSEYDNMSDAEKAALKQQMKANAAVMYFATDAAGRSAAEVKQSVTDFMGLMKMAQNEAWVNRNVSDEYLADYYRSTLTPEQQAEFDKLSASDKQQAVDKFCNAQQSFGDMKLTGKEAAAMAYAAEQRGVSVDTGISTLGSMYALATGFYESDYYTGSDDAIPNLSEFDSVQQAMADPNFQKYLDEQGEQDLEAYLSFMDYLSTGDVEMDSTGAFSGQGDYMEGVTG